MTIPSSSDFLNSDYTYKHRPQKSIFPSIEDDMAAEIRRLTEEVTTLRATIGMVRAVLATVPGNDVVGRVIDNLGTV